MAVREFTIRLTSDAEPGTGLGGEITNEFVPRDHRGSWIVPRTHLKGLMRQGVIDAIRLLGRQDEHTWTDDLLDRTFGWPGEASDPGSESSFRLTDAVASNATAARLVARTAIDPATGTAKEQSLRTAESIPVGTEFKGRLITDVAEGTVEDLAQRFSLLAIGAIGGNRTRGCGSCVVDFVEPDTESRTPGELLKALHRAIRDRAFAKPKRVGVIGQRGAPTGSIEESVVLRLVFRAETPICCPEIPDKTNVIGTGFSIPASAVQGVVLHRLNEIDEQLAGRVFNSRFFRAWPLLPCRHPDDAVDPAALSTVVRVSLTHRMAKFSEPHQEYGPGHFQDEAIEPYDWDAVPNRAPLKAADGVLLRRGEQTLLWKATSMPHLVTSHGVHNDPHTEGGRNLYTVDALAPTDWSGLVVMPQTGADTLLKSLSENPIVAVGKRRSVGGIGKLTADVLEELPAEWLGAPAGHTTLVVQSPLLLPDRAPHGVSAEAELEQLAGSWCAAHGLPAPARWDGAQNRDQTQVTWANIGLRFGWNRASGGRQRARRVILPGSVFTFAVQLDPERLSRAIRYGVHDAPQGAVDDPGRCFGFGAVSVHPGRATGLYSPERRSEPMHGKSCQAVRLVLSMRKEAGVLPSASQLRALQQRLTRDDPQNTAAKAYLERQLTGRTSRIWFAWESIQEGMKQLLSDHRPDQAGAALDLLIDLGLADGRRQQR